MIELLMTASTHQLEFRFSGRVTQSDYDEVVLPAVKEALGEHDRIRVLAIADEGFTGFDMGAVWADTRMGLSHWRGFDRIAVATDKDWMTVGTRAFALLAPCPLKAFSISETDEARRWLRESLGTVHLSELGGTAIQVRLLGKLDPEVLANASESLSAHIQEHGGFKLLLDLREFEGWQGLSALGAHLGLVRDHSDDAQRIAVVGKKSWQHMAQRVAGQVLRAETRFFDAEELDAAKAWVLEA
ncbi:MAG: STAS/SEC14 domain-containing protein [Paracoccaceae bacterium]